MDRTIELRFLLGVGVLAWGGCRHTSTGSLSVARGEAEALPVQESSTPVVGHLKTREKVITIRSGRDGPLYTVKSEDGTVLAVDLSAEDLSAKFPKLKGVVEGGIADWAGMDLPQQTIESSTYETTTIIERNNGIQPAMLVLPPSSEPDNMGNLLIVSVRTEDQWSHHLYDRTLSPDAVKRLCVALGVGEMVGMNSDQTPAGDVLKAAPEE